MLNTFKVIPFICLFLFSCGKDVDLDKSSKKKTTSKKEPVVFSDFDKFRKQFDELDINCSTSQCPDNLVLLGVYNSVSGKADYCNGFVLKNGKVITSSSCVKFREIRDGESCSELLLLRSDKIKKSLSCNFIESVNLGNRERKNKDFGATWNRDFVLINFDSVKVKPNSKIDFNLGIPQGDRYTLWSYEVYPESNRSIAKPESCRIIDGTYLNPLSTSAYSSNRAVFCSSKKSQFTSSAFLFNNSINRVFGMYSKGLNPDLKKWLRQSKDVHFSSSSIFAGYITNFTCWNYLNSSTPNACFDDYSYSSVDEARAFLLDIETSATNEFKRELKKIESIYSKTDLFIKWKTSVENIGFTYEVIAHPQCFHQTSQWPDDLKKKFEYQVEIDKYVLKPSIDNYFKLRIYTQKVKKQSFHLKFNPKKVLKKGFSDLEFKLSEIDSRGNIRYIYNDEEKDFPVCN